MAVCLMTAILFLYQLKQYKEAHLVKRNTFTIITGDFIRKHTIDQFDYLHLLIIN